jgi:octaprenyl-diphosphate synthase
MNDLKNKLLAMVKDDLRDIELALKDNLKPWLDLVSQIAGHLLFSGGKRLRPLLTALSARICGYSGDINQKFSMITEYIHTATLLHDDLVDGACFRRGKPAANCIWDAPHAVLVGDFLLARALSIGAETGNAEVIRILAEVTEHMSQGEIYQLMKKRDLRITEKEYLTVIHNKTAMLIQGACRIGSVIADGEDQAKSAISKYGLNVGFAFQMADDLLDYTSDTGALGKEVGADLKEGKLTLPVIYALQKAEKEDRLRMENIITNPEDTKTEFKEFFGFLEKYNGILYTKNKASMYVEEAKKAVKFFAPSETRDILIYIADYALNRVS